MLAALTTGPASQRAPEAQVAWRGGTAGGADACVFAWNWRNPRLAKTITSLDILSSGTAASPIVVAVSGRLALK